MIKKTFYPNYNEVEDWKILDKRLIHSYGDIELPIEVICVEIGTLDISYPTAFGSTLERTPIIRWMSRDDYRYFKEQRGVVIF